MWKAFIALIGHRFLLFLTAFLVINAKLPSTTSGVLPQLHPTKEILSKGLQRIFEGPEFARLDKAMAFPPSAIFKSDSDPFLWMARWLVAITGLSPHLILILLSNLFFLIFLSELFATLSRMVPTEVAEGALLLLILWPTSYEMSVGSSWAMTSCLATVVIREAMDNRWLIGGIAMGLLTLQHPLAVGLIPLLAYLFWYFQRHFLAWQILKRASFFLIPLGIALFFRWSELPSFKETLSQSALWNVAHVIQTAGKGASWTFSQSFSGQTLTILFFAIGAGVSLFSHSGFLHRILPLHMLLLLLLYTPYGGIASRASLAASCLAGISSASSPIVNRAIQMLLLLLSLYEVGVVFSYA